EFRRVLFRSPLALRTHSKWPTPACTTARLWRTSAPPSRNWWTNVPAPRSTPARDSTKAHNASNVFMDHLGKADSHVPEQRHERRTDGEGLGARLEPPGAAAAVVADHAGDRAQVDDGRTVDLLERGRVQRGQQVLDRRAQQRLAVGGHDGGVLVVGAEVRHLVDQYQAGLAAGAGGQPGQRRRGVVVVLVDA